MDNQKRFIKCIMGNLLYGNTKISIERLININSNNKLYFKSLLSDDEIVELDNMQYGVFQARRGWLTKKDVLNTYSLKKLMSSIQK